jgi:hypothetical protein
MPHRANPEASMEGKEDAKDPFFEEARRNGPGPAHDCSLSACRDSMRTRRRQRTLVRGNEADAEGRLVDTGGLRLCEALPIQEIGLR